MRVSSSFLPPNQKRVSFQGVVPSQSIFKHLNNLTPDVTAVSATRKGETVATLIEKFVTGLMDFGKQLENDPKAKGIDIIIKDDNGKAVTVIEKEGKELLTFGIACFNPALKPKSIEMVPYLFNNVSEEIKHSVNSYLANPTIAKFYKTV